MTVIVAASVEVMPMTTPTRIGAFRVERLLGAGSFATVWLAYDPDLADRVAVKVLAENWSHDLRVRERFLDEARLLRRLDDDRLVRVHGVGELPDGRPYAVLAWADGGSLRDRLARGPLPVGRALAVLDEIAAGVAVLHRHRVVHRDLTPSNVLFHSGPDGERVLIADLGLAKALASASGLTARAGTPGYMAPEQNEPLAVVDTRADVYGLGRLGLRLLGRGGPADAEPAASRLRAGVPAGVDSVLRRATALRPADRYPDADAFRQALRRAVDGGPALVRTRRAPRPGRLLAGVAVALAVAGTGAGDTARPAAAGEVGRSGPLTVVLPAGWRAEGTGWAGQYGDDGDLEPALVISPDPGSWAVDPALPGAFVGLSAGTARRTGPAGFLAERPHADCAGAPQRHSRQGGVEWTVVTFTCPTGRPVIVEAAGLAPGRAGLLYVQLVPPAGAGADFVDGVLAGVRAG
ncbi:serine/threonine-protein kinase [Micromonospora sp. C32]|uniref:serine/threonine-protein kinase n=1 Tax=Micromonospora sp. C32 TaxID=2824877 RepID=UPI0027DD2DB9|nr:serine/threonine-protein kinase [Micromonospora sp. C32]